MSKRKVLLIIVVILLLIIGTVIFVFLTSKEEWKKVSIENCSYYDDTEIQLDLDGDGVTENIKIYKSGKDININNKDYVINKYAKEDSSEIGIGSKNSIFSDYSSNHFEIVDLNGDGVLEIIHSTSERMISPPNKNYTVYNYKGNKIKEVGKFSIIGDMPNDVYIKGNTLKFEYWPYESPENYRKEIVCNLDI